MPHKDRDAWHRSMREFMNENSGCLAKKSEEGYYQCLEKAGRYLGYPSPRLVSLQEMRELEPKMGTSQNSRCVQATIVRAFLRWFGNRDALKWKIVSKQHPKADRIYVTEAQIEYLRSVAHAMGPQRELIFSLAVDNGLRVVDMRRLTIPNAEQLLKSGQSMIIGKGRGGGKHGLLVLSPATFSPLVDYMKHRRQLIEKYGTPRQELLIKESQWKTRLLPMDYKTVKEEWKTIMKEAGMSANPHDGRAWFGHRHHLIGTPIETIAKLMRHQSINQSFRAYIGIDSDEMRAAQDKLIPREILRHRSA